MRTTAKKIKIRVRKGGWLYLTLPALSFNFMKRISRWGLKIYQKSSRNHLGKSGNLPADIEMIDLEKQVELIFDELAEQEPFVIAEVSEETENIYVKIETL